MLAFLLVGVNRLAALALPTASRYVVDQVVGRQRTDLLGLIALLAYAAVAIEAAAAFGAAQLAGVAGQRAIAGLRQDLQERVVGLPLSHIDTTHTGALAARVMMDPEQVQYLVGNGLVQLVASSVTATLSLGILFWLNARLTLAVVLFLLVLAVGVHRGFRRISASLEGLNRLQSELTGWFGQVLGGVRIVKAYVAERHEGHRFAQQSHRLVREGVHAVRGISLLNASSALMTGAVGVLLLVAGGHAVATGLMSLGSFVMYVWLSGFLLTPIIHIAAGAGELGKAVAALSRIAELRLLATEEEEDRVRTGVHRIVGAVEFEDVSYGYAPGQPALRGISLHAPAGSTIALLGRNGSGKSTLCRLLLAYDRPAAGRILVDGRDLASMRRRDYRAHLGVVLQDDVIFAGTIGDNIRYGRPRASLPEVRAAGRLARCDEFVARLPRGYATPVGERGLRLSAGQRQRVAIARAFLVNPRILILDEATSALDAESEELIRDALRVLCRGRTTFVVAHRFSTVQGADQILMLDRGAIIERGTHEELLVQRGRYFSLYEAQSRELPNSLVGLADPVKPQFERRSRDRAGSLAGGNGREH